MQDQNIKGLEAAYQAVFNRPLKERVDELCNKYKQQQWDDICTELNPENAVPCHWSLTELHNHYSKEI